MTVSSTTSKVSYSGNGTTTAFAVSFYFLADSQLTVTLRAADGSESTKVLGVDYTVSGAGVSTGGTVTMTVAPASGTTLVISRNVPLTQETDLQPNDRLPAETLEDSIDKLTMIDQQTNEKIGRTLRAPITDSSALDMTLPSSAERATKFLKFNTSGEPIAATVPESTITVEDYGAVGDGEKDDTEAIQAALNALTAGDTLLFRNNYKINDSLTITNKTRIRLTGKGRVFLSGAASGAYIFQLVGTCDDIEIDGLTLVGENNSGYGQTAIGAATGQTISNTRFHDLNISQINVGISLNAFPTGSWTRAMVYANILKDIPGTVSGSGYGIHIPNTTDSHIFDNTIENCNRHSIYQASGTNCNNVIANNVIRKHRYTTGDGSFRSAAVIARSSNVTFTGNKFYDCKDCCLEVAHVTSDSTNCTNVLIEGNSFTNRANAVHTILIGEQLIPTSYSTSHINIFNNTFDDDLSVTAALPPNIYILNGTNVTIESNRFVRRNVSGSLSACILVGDDTYLNADTQIADISVRNNIAIADGTAGSTGFVTICEELATGSTYYWVKDNIAKNWPKLITWENTDDPPTGAVTPTNQNSFFKFRIPLTYDFGSISANTGAVYVADVDGCKRTSLVRGRPVYSTIDNGVSYTFYARDNAENAVVIQAVNVTTSAIDPASQTFLLEIEDVEPYYG